MTSTSPHRLFAVLLLALTTVSAAAVIDARAHAAPHPATVRTATVQQQAAIDWDAVGQALGKTGQVMAGGITITTLHNHLNQIAPHVMYLHYEAHGDPVQLASALHQALMASGTPFGPSPASTIDAMGTDTSQLEHLLGHMGALSGNVFQVNVPRAETITEMGMVLLPAMGVATVLNFQLMGQGQAAITGDLALTAGEVNPVAVMLRAQGIEVTALHSHALYDQPRLFYLHFWATGDAMTLAGGLRAALDQTNSVPSAP